jgi:crooked neck
LEEGALRDLKDEGATLEEKETAAVRVREVYERAVAQVPPGEEKRFWRRYVFLWLEYALFEEIETKVREFFFGCLIATKWSSQNYARARHVYQTAITVVPHKEFTFAKLWLMFAKFEIRRLDLSAARKILGTAIGLCPKPALFQGYIDLEIQVSRGLTFPYFCYGLCILNHLFCQLREFDRTRQLYEKYLLALSVCHDILIPL